MAVHYNFITKEPYLQLPAPCDNIIITSFREHQIKENVLFMTDVLNDARVYSWLEGPPYPFRPEHGEDWVKMKTEENKAIVSALQKELEVQSHEQNDENPEPTGLEFFDGCPFTCIREVQKRDSGNGLPVQDTLIGDISLSRYSFYEIRQGSWELALVQGQNNRLPAGHEDIVWGIGNYLAPTHHGKGIMSRAVQTVIRDWAVPRMNMHHLRGSFHAGNVGSQKVFERNNFEEIGFFKDWSPASPNKGRGKTSIVVMEWKGSDI